MEKLPILGYFVEKPSTITMTTPKTNRFFILMTFVYLIAGLTSTYFMVKNAQAYNKQKTQYTETLNFQDRLLNAREWMFASEWDKKRVEADKIFAEARVNYTLAKRWGYLNAAVLVIYLILILLFFRVNSLFYKKMSIGFISIAFVCLVAGIFTPMLEIDAFSKNLEIPLKTKVNLGITKVNVDLSKTFEGRMYFYYQNKSITGLIELLFQKKNWIVGGAILAFSVLVPLVKLIFSLLLLFSGIARNSDWIKRLISSIGKWSMADVFVAAIFLAYLSFQNMNSGINTESNPLLGAYFFLAYCLFSISSTYFIQASIKRELY
ncbi:hypothetical protein BKI52_29795 [marine bacterium AO1-C]|nr:hypothetical protein BKI52_29795 [marine bacterium AO1-C]